MAEDTFENLFDLTKEIMDEINEADTLDKDSVNYKKRTAGKKTHDVQDVIDAEVNLEPMKCRYCGSNEVTFDQNVGDAYCANCGRWQNE